MADLGSYKAGFSTFRFAFSPGYTRPDFTVTHWADGDIPILADVNGDGAHYIGVFRGAVAGWWLKCSPATATARARHYQRLIDLVVRRFLTRAQLPAEVRAEMTEGYREDILRLQDLIGRNLSHWLDAENQSTPSPHRVEGMTE